MHAQQKPAETSSGSAEWPSRSPPTISLPRGGGAIRGISEKFAANPVTGTGSMTVPIATSPGRSGFGPQLALSYDSGASNGPYGFGWSLSLASITRKTDKGLPKYEDADESDLFILSGAEDLVPAVKADPATGEFVKDAKGNFVYDEFPRDGYVIRRYRPRIEGLFARIERWTNATDAADVFWRSISKDNITTFYGKTEASRIANPEDPSQIFSWLICQSYDDKGNAIVYKYKAETSDGIDLAQAHEKNRTALGRSANRYLKGILYGNRTPNRSLTTWQATDPAQLPDSTWMFEVVFDYEDGHYQEQQPDANGRIFAQATIAPSPNSSWPVREDPFSSYRAGFEVRTYRLCRRVLMFHHFPDELGTPDYLVRSTEFTYDQTPIASFITAVTQSGYARQPNGNYLKKSLPPVEFEYSEATINEEVQDVDPESLQNLPVGPNGAGYQWLDLDGEGLQSVLAEQQDAWYYKRNVSPLSFRFANGKPTSAARFDPVTEVATLPSFAETLAQRHQFLDLAGDGQLDCVVLERPVAGFFERTYEQDWEGFKPLPSLPNLDWTEPNLRFVDLTGDGHADILITEHEALVWHPALEEEGFGEAIRISKPHDEEKGPVVVAFADPTQAIFLADLSGDGLTDIVRIRNGEICYWSNLGYGRFGAKVTMDNSPWFDAQDQFDQERVRLADIDGSGTTDVIYLHRDGVNIYRNRCGNGWSDVEQLSTFPAVNNVSSVQAVDLLGNGTACLVWTSPLPGDSSRPMRYIDLMGGEKPHLLIKTMNNLGAETVVQYAPSTKFYLQDNLDGKPWITRLPFPVHCVERVETYDRISGNRFVSRYKYHHGYFDGVEREFRGFGMVEQTDTEEIGDIPADTTSSEATNLDAASFVPPTRTKTWFHTGVYDEIDEVSQHFAAEYYGAPEPGDPDYATKFSAFSKALLPDTILPPDLTLGEEREAARALKGAMLRQEIYADDAPEGASEEMIKRAKTPYTVTEQNFTIELLQPQGTNKHTVVLTHAREALSYHYERNPDDPRAGHAITLESDKYGNVLKSVAIGYGRGVSPLAEKADREKQTQTLITYTQNDVTNPIDDAAHPDDCRTPLSAEARTFELTGYKPANSAGRFQISDFVQPDPDDPDGREQVHIFDSELNYEEPATTDRQRRLIECVRTLYRSNDLTGLLPFGQLQSLALPGESYKLAFTPGLLNQIYRRPLSVVPPPNSPPPEVLLPGNIASLLGSTDPDGGGYVDVDPDGIDHWWIPSAQIFFSTTVDVTNPAGTAPEELMQARQHFFLPRKFTDPFGHSSTVDYDTHDLLLSKTEDALQNPVTALHDYRVLQAKSITDPNGNRSEGAFDALGMVVATALKGKADQNLGDLLEDFDADPPLGNIQSFTADPQAQAAALIGKATTRILCDLDRFWRCGQPPFASVLARETHFLDPGGSQTKIQISFSYSDGFGREIQKKIQAEAGDAPQRQGNVTLPSGDFGPGNLVVDADGKPMQTSVLQRWVGTGRTVFNNKGKPVRQYEPFFSATHFYEAEPEMTNTGVSPVLFYDPIERVVATLHPDHTWEKVVFDAWQQATYDVNDTVLNADDSTDPTLDENVKGFFSRLPDADYLPTWYEQRVTLAATNPERVAADKAAIHRQTPTLAHFDTLGRAFLTVAHNRLEQDHTIVEEEYPTRVELDIEGNQRVIIDAKECIVLRYDYDMLGNRIHHASMEAGERWMLNDVAGKPIRAWDSRGFMRRMRYDELRRATGLFVTEGGIDRLAERTVYGESQGAEANHRTRVFQVFDAAGVVTSEGYDFKGNLLQSKRELLSDYKSAVDWHQNPAPNYGTFTTRTTYDALNRPLTIATPGGSVYHPTFNEANLLDKVDVKLRGAADATSFVTNLNYNAKGQRALIAYGNGAKTAYEYDPLTFRLTKLRTARTAGPNGLASQLFTDPTVVQDLRYTYDPAGNITRIEDAALKTNFHNGQQVEPVCDYSYDAIYRLIEASGREQIAQIAHDFNPQERRDFDFVGLAAFMAHPNDLQAVRRYTERYEYDAVGNFNVMRHIANGGSWTRGYAYDEASLLEPPKQSNRLSQSTVGNNLNFAETYTYTDAQGNDVHGCMTAMNSMLMEWDFKDQLQKADLGGGGKTFYVYDAAGQRARKVIEMQNGKRKGERIYVGGFEIYREFNGGGNTVILEREMLHVRDDTQRIALVETKTAENGISISAPIPVQRYQLGNHLGTACLELDKDGGLISYEEYHPYGTTAFQVTNSAAEVSLKRYRYTGKERDEETGLYYYGARYYAPWLARWTAADTVLADGTNLYRYTRGNPVVLNDPSGRESAAEARAARQREYNALQADFTKKHSAIEKRRSELLAEAAKLRATVPDLHSALGFGSAALSRADAAERAAGEALGEQHQLEERWFELQMRYHALEPQQLAGRAAAEPPRDKLAEYNAAVAALKASPVTSIAFAFYAASGATFEQQQKFIAVGSALEAPATVVALGAGAYLNRSKPQAVSPSPKSPAAAAPAPGASPNEACPDCSFRTSVVLEGIGRTPSGASDVTGIPQGLAYPEDILAKLGTTTQTTLTYTYKDPAKVHATLQSLPAGTNVQIYYNAVNSEGKRFAHSTIALVGKGGAVKYVDFGPFPRTYSGPPVLATDQPPGAGFGFTFFGVEPAER